MNILVITATFPPRGGSSVQRVSKFVKYAHRAGHKPVVLTARDSGAHLDESLEADIPPDVEVHRLPVWTGGGGLLDKIVRRISWPDAYKGWARAAERKGAELLEGRQFDAVLVSFGMPSALRAGARLARAFDKPLVLDIRDFWTITRKGNRRHRLGPLVAPLDRRLEREAWRDVDRFVVVSQGYAETLRMDYGVDPTRVDVIYNGFDPADMAALPTSPDPPRSDGPVIGFAGFVSERSALRTLLRSLGNLNRRRGEAGTSPINLDIIGGTARAVFSEELGGAEWPEWLRVEGYRPHDEALSFMRSADLLLLMQPYEHGMLTGKLFEYIGVRRPILHLDNGTRELAQIIGAYSLGSSVPHDDELAIANAVEALIANPPKLGEPPAEFRRDHQADQFLSSIYQAIADHRKEPADAHA